MTLSIHITLDRAAPARLIGYAAERGLAAFTLVADRNTYAVLGQQVEAALCRAGLDLQTIVLPGEEIVANEAQIVHILMRAAVGGTCYLAVGSGTITDITRFVSYRTRNRFISLPTAPSMDGYATSSNALTIGGLKLSIPGQAPEAIFCDIDTLAVAPRPLIAAGLADTLAKFTSVNDLRLGHLLWDERWDEAIGERMENLAASALARADEIARADADAIGLLTRTLLDSGLAMAAFGNSTPGGGSEHHISHCWEMRMLRAGLPALLHGAKVGVGTVIAAGWYARVREMSRDEAASRLTGAAMPDARATEEMIRRVYGPVADQIIAQQAHFVRMWPEQWAALKQRTLDHWEDIRAIAARVPAPEAIAAVLRSAGGPATAQELGVSEEEARIATDYGHFTRPRFTIAKLRLLLGIQTV
jgi:glycerol-1-phosphate dehydrogenase [NAD(P)+]